MWWGYSLRPEDGIRSPGVRGDCEAPITSVGKWTEILRKGSKLF